MDLTKNVSCFISRTVIDNDKFNSHAGFTEDLLTRLKMVSAALQAVIMTLTSILFFILSYDFPSLSSLRRLIGIILLSLISWSVSNKHSSQNSLSSESHRSRTFLFLLQRAHLFIFPRLGDHMIWGTWKMDAASLGQITNRNKGLFCVQCKTRITRQGA